jgi:hypothetical protein
MENNFHRQSDRCDLNMNTQIKKSSSAVPNLKYLKKLKVKELGCGCKTPHTYFELYSKSHECKKLRAH